MLLSDASFVAHSNFDTSIVTDGNSDGGGEVQFWITVITSIEIDTCQCRRFEMLPDEYKTLRSPGHYRVSTTSGLNRLHAKIRRRSREHEGLA